MSSWQCWMMTSAILMGAMACSKSDPEPVNTPMTAPAAENIEPAPAPQPAQPALDALSGLTIKRGIVTLALQGGTFKPCGESVELWLVDQSQGTLQEILAAAAAPLVLYAEAYGERAPLPAEPAAVSYSGAFVVEEILYASTNTVASGCDSPEPDYVVAAKGTDSSWSVEVTDQRLTWRQPGIADIVIDAEQAEDAEGAVSYQGRSVGHTLQLVIAAQVCSDAAKGEFFAYSARAVLDGKEFKGCARVGE